MKGILFTSENHKAIRDLKKTVTRREEASLKEINKESDTWTYSGKSWLKHMAGEPDTFFFRKGKQELIVRPRYLPGETVYIKEAFYAYGRWANLPEGWRFVRDESAIIHYADEKWAWALTKPSAKEAWYKRSPMFLPEADARDFIQILSVRPERLQEITEDDAVREGVLMMPSGCWTKETGTCNNGCLAYAGLWDSINGAGAWAKNPWVWRYEFKLIKKDGKLLDAAGILDPA